MQETNNETSKTLENSGDQNPWIDTGKDEPYIKTYEQDTKEGKMKVIEIKVEYLLGFIVLFVLITSVLVYAPWE